MIYPRRSGRKQPGLVFVARGSVGPEWEAGTGGADAQAVRLSSTEVAAKRKRPEPQEPDRKHFRAEGSAPVRRHRFGFLGEERPKRLFDDRVDWRLS